MPPPSAKPRIPAITGRGIAATPSNARAEGGADRPGRGLVTELLDVGAGGERLLRSRGPRRPSPRRRRTERRRRRRRSAPSIAVESGFIGGRLRRSVATPSGRGPRSAPGRRSCAGPTVGPVSRGRRRAARSAAACGSSSRARDLPRPAPRTRSPAHASATCSSSRAATMARSSSRSRASRRRSRRPPCLLERPVLAGSRPTARRCPRRVSRPSARSSAATSVCAGQVEHQLEVADGLGDAVAVGLVHHEEVGDLHEPGLVGLHAVTPAGVHHDDGRVGGAGDLDLDLTDADRLDDDPRLAGRVEHPRRARRREREPAEVTPGRHRADVDARRRWRGPASARGRRGSHRR